MGSPEQAPQWTNMGLTETTFLSDAAVTRVAFPHSDPTAPSHPLVGLTEAVPLSVCLSPLIHAPITHVALHLSVCAGVRRSAHILERQALARVAYPLLCCYVGWRCGLNTRLLMAH